MGIFVDMESGRILHTVEGKGEKDITSFLKVLRRETRNLEAVAMGMSAAFMSAVEERLPHVPIVFDRYHVSTLINKGIEELRRDQRSQQDEEEKRVLRGSRFLFLTNYETLDQGKQTRLDQLLGSNAPLLTIHTMKGKLRDFWEKDSMQESILS